MLVTLIATILLILAVSEAFLHRWVPTHALSIVPKGEMAAKSATQNRGNSLSDVSTAY